MRAPIPEQRASPGVGVAATARARAPSLGFGGLIVVLALLVFAAAAKPASTEPTVARFGVVTAVTATVVVVTIIVAVGDGRLGFETVDGALAVIPFLAGPLQHQLLLARCQLAALRHPHLELYEMVSALRLLVDLWHATVGQPGDLPRLGPRLDLEVHVAVNPFDKDSAAEDGLSERHVHLRVNVGSVPPEVFAAKHPDPHVDTP
mmetsp:Transcript_34203/g.89743  ORF Transcript_34203/g.89743 Transcript_34203/m.89743 type:complete len:205 (-) Transcript_34203:440-1054(-)